MRILIAEDDIDSQKLLKLILGKENHEIVTADNGLIAWEKFQKEDIHLVITDWIMPEITGIDLCKKIREKEPSGSVYIIMVTSKEEKQDLITAINAGANDYITKPYNKGELLARVRSGGRMVSLEQELINKNKEILSEKAKSEQLLNSIFPRFIVERLKQGEKVVADSYPDVTILFADINNFSSIFAHKEPVELVNILGQIFSVFDRLVMNHALEKIKTIGDTYMAVGGVSVQLTDHAEAIADVALAMQEEIIHMDLGVDEALQLRIGIHTGSVVAGVIGTTKQTYDLWGEAVNTAYQMKTYGLPGSIQVSASTYERLHDKYMIENRGEFYVLGKGPLKTYILSSRKEHSEV